MITIDNDYQWGDTVYHKLTQLSADENLKGVVIALKASSPQDVEYIVVWENEVMGSHTCYEIQSEDEYNTNKIL